MNAVNKKSFAGRFALLCFGICLVSSLPVVFAWSIPGIEDLKLTCKDLRFQIRGEREPSGEVVIAAIDERSLQLVGRWPWSRAVFAELAARLYNYGVKTIGFDLLFLEPEKNVVQGVVQDLMHSYVELGLLKETMPSQVFLDEMQETLELANDDQYFADVAQQAGNVVFGMALKKGAQRPEQIPEHMERAAYGTFAGTDRIDRFSPYSAQTVLLPIDVLGQAAAQLGFVNFAADQDGVMREGLLAMEYSGALFAPLSVRLVYVHLVVLAFWCTDSISWRAAW